MRYPDLLENLLEERVRQIAKFGERWETPEKRIVVMTEELGEIAKAINNKDEENLKEELLQL
jgi:NTP pyrophosphatase (non-canonical NTP hydrolase)